jgi:hypothetical protein
VALNHQVIIEFSMKKEMRIMNLRQNILVHKRIISAVKRVEFISVKMSYIILRDPGVLNVHTPTEDKTNDTKDSFCEELEYVFNVHEIIGHHQCGFQCIKSTTDQIFCIC